MSRLNTRCIKQNLSHQILIFLALLLIMLPSGHTRAAQKSWYDMSIFDLFIDGALEDLKAPTFSYANFFQQGNVVLDVASPAWVNASGTTILEKDKMVKVDMFVDGLYQKPRKYKILYRIDPRFSEPQIFIAQFNYKSNSYEFDTKELLTQLSKSNNFNQKVSALKDYFYFNSRSKIAVNNGEFIYFTIANDSFGLNPNNTNSITDIYTTNTITNKIIYTTSDVWCNSLYNSPIPENYYGCVQGQYFISPSFDNKNLFFGLVQDPNFIKASMNISACNSSHSSSSLCYYENGKGMQIYLNNIILKDTNVEFDQIPNNANSFRYLATSDGVLDFRTNFNTNGMFKKFPGATIENWTNESDVDNSYDNNRGLVNFLHFGSYVMYVEIGSGSPKNSPDALDVYWTISDSIPGNSITGTKVNGKEDKFDAPQDGNLWLRVVNNNSDLTGNIKVNYAGYVGSNNISTFLDETLIKPLDNTFTSIAAEVFNNLKNNTSWFNIARMVMVLYVIIYSIYFLLGAAKITALDLVKIIVKIIIVNIMFSANSWQFFKDNLFDIFLDGADYLIESLTDTTSSSKNIFGFIDPLLSYYFNGSLWAVVAIEFFSFSKGLTLFAILFFISIYRFIIIIVNLLVTYILGVLATAVLISLLPIFIIFIAFEKTRPLFNSWMSSLLQYFVQPIIMFLFFLVIQQINLFVMAEALVDCQWKIIIPFYVSIDLPIVNITLSFPLAPFPGIAFYTPVFNDNHTFLTVSSATFLLYMLSLMVKGFIDYTTAMSAAITGTQGLPDPAAPFVDGISKQFGLKSDDSKK